VRYGHRCVVHYIGISLTCHLVLGYISVMSSIVSPTLTTTVITVPCMSGAPWQLDRHTAFKNRSVMTYRLPERIDTFEQYVDDLEMRTKGFERFALVGDSFGAVVALGLAVRRPARLAALVMSGGFASQPLSSFSMRFGATAAGLVPRPLYKNLALRVHADALHSRHDLDGEVPWSRKDSRNLFLEHTPFESYKARLAATRTVDYRGQLHDVEVPTLILTPQHDTLIGREAATTLLSGIPDAREVVLPHTGHMLRFTHPEAYAAAIEAFLGGVLNAA